MKIKNIQSKIIQTMFLGFWISQPVLAITQNYDMEIKTGDRTNTQYMKIAINNDEIEVTIIDEKKEKQIVNYKNNIKMQKAQYINAENKKFLDVDYDYQNKKISISGVINSVVGLKESMFDNNGSLFYLFSQIYPQKGEPMIFTLLQSKLNRTVEMYLKLTGEEEIIIGGKKIKALKYEMGIHEFMLSVFWPYKYYYWYSANDRRFLKYEGPDENKKVQTIQLIKYFEK